MFWANENPHIIEDRNVNVPGVTVGCGLSSRRLIAAYRFEEIFTGQTYLEMLKIVRMKLGLFSTRGIPLQSHANVKDFLKHTFNQRWIG